MGPPKESIEEFKRIFKEEYGKELSDQDAHELANNLMGFVEVLCEYTRRDYQSKQQLKKEPEGFHLTDGTYNCSIYDKQITSSYHI